MEEVSKAWGWALFFGILTLVIGILVMVWPEATLKVFTIFFALQLFVTGIYYLVKSFSAANQHKVLTVFLGILSVIVAVITPPVCTSMSTPERSSPATTWMEVASLTSIAAGCQVVA